ncbi:septum formation protein Maf [Putridiphycobacter roseus]|uniref:dTTP/UTP pyrophosphatase n=1 Tax=Putridiphycobacter roseus TaxID=2219161 RepID=A0A2W1NL84_9FLAO|nr:Maf family nucleotide pyrophosphatase [Putridiphycobacter roseus]PZE18606.1 septum formation protein Maf [Putridiphycobacter roseus]
MLLENIAHKKVILASKSPRRQELLKGLNIPFEVLTREVDESYPKHLAPTEIATFLAEKKANAFLDILQADNLIICADTIVVLGEVVLGKPKDATEAFEMLRALSGKQHQVITGVCVKTDKKTISFSSTTTVAFKTLEDSEIKFYIDTYKPYDKAGSYGIQEWIGYIGISNINGSYFNVMGLPLFELNEVLAKI